MAKTPAQFLVESLVADALLLGQWGAQEPLETLQAHGPELTVADELPVEPNEPLSKAELRRKRNRERIKETRQMQKESMEQIRKTVQQLTKQLHLMKTQRLDRSDSTESSAEYAALVSATHRLKAEKVLLKRMLIQQENAALRLVGVMGEIDSWAPVPDPVEDTAAAFGEFCAITHAQAQASIAHACRSFALYERWATPVSQYIGDASAPALTFGWAVTCALRPGSFYYLAMTKSLPGVKARQAMLRSWTVMSRPYVTDESPSLRIAQSALLQRLDSSTCVMGSDWFHPVKPGVCMRSISVRQCQATERGFAIKQGTLNPQDPELRHQVLKGIEYMDALNWHVFTDEEDGCVAALKVLWLYDTLESMHLRVVNALSAAWRWESGFNDSWRLLKM